LLQTSEISEVVADSDSDGAKVIKRHQLSWGKFGKCAWGVTTSTVLQNSKLSWVNFIQCLWRRGWWWEWVRWTDWTGSNSAMDMLLLPSEKCSTHTGGPREKDNEASHTNDGSSPLSVFLLYFAEIITLLLVKTNRYYHDYRDLMAEPLMTLTLLKPKCLCLWQ
jgi:hypothetical protein